MWLRVVLEFFGQNLLCQAHLGCPSKKCWIQPQQWLSEVLVLKVLPNIVIILLYGGPGA